MATKTILLVVEVREDKLKGNAYTRLPDTLDAMISTLLPNGALDLTTMYLLNPRCPAEPALSDMALDYHHYAVNIRGEKCEETDCEQHQLIRGLALYDYGSSNQAPPGVN